MANIEITLSVSKVRCCGFLVPVSDAKHQGDDKSLIASASVYLLVHLLGKLFLLSHISWSSLFYMYRLKGRICQSVVFGHHFFTYALIERENLSVCVSWSSLLYMYRLKGRICQSVFLGHHCFTCALIEREIVFVILEIVFVIPSLLYTCTDY